MSLAKCLTGIWILILPPTFSLFSIRKTSSEKSIPSRPSTTESTVFTPNDPILQLSLRRESSPVYPALLLGLAMTTRGEIGFLIAAVAQSARVISPDEVYLVIIWGILLCTLTGPIGVGIIVRRIKRLGRENVLGGWGEVAEERPFVRERQEGRHDGLNRRKTSFRFGVGKR